jgi:hypothetical protein
MHARFDKPAAFTPVTISITCETQDDLDMLGTLFNIGCLSHVIGRVFPESSYDAASLFRVLKNAGADISTRHDLFRSLLAEWMSK